MLPRKAYLEIDIFALSSYFGRRALLIANFHGFFNFFKFPVPVSHTLIFSFRLFDRIEFSVQLTLHFKSLSEAALAYFLYQFKLTLELISFRGKIQNLIIRIKHKNISYRRINFLKPGHIDLHLFIRCEGCDIGAAFIRFESETVLSGGKKRETKGEII